MGRHKLVAQFDIGEAWDRFSQNSKNKNIQVPTYLITYVHKQKNVFPEFWKTFIGHSFNGLSQFNIR